MTTRSEREKALKQNEQHQALLVGMLREEDNKYCADCEAKGPRWASWNLGVFMCIRCAGIHRNLGVHISRVKSVNLDQWTPEQIQNIQEMGNRKARRLYEANLPDSFRRPQSDHAVEIFIRDKYEKKKYMDKSLDINALKSSASSASLSGESRVEKEKDKRVEEKKKEKPVPLSKPKASPEQQQQRPPIPLPKAAAPPKPAEPPVDLLGLDAQGWHSEGSAVPNGTGGGMGSDLDIFGPMVSNPLPVSTSQDSTGMPASESADSGSNSDLSLFSEAAAKAEDAAKKPLTKDSIMSLYGPVPSQNLNQGMYYAPTPSAAYAQQSQLAASYGQPPVGYGAPGSMTQQQQMQQQQQQQAMVGLMAQQQAMAGLMAQQQQVHQQQVLAGVMAQQQMAGVMAGVPNGYGPNAGAVTPAMMGLSVGPGMVGGQHGMVAQPVYGMAPQMNAAAHQWNVNQLSQQMAGMAVGVPAGVIGYAQPSGGAGGVWGAGMGTQSLATHTWK
ncbi:stromal membrane-associated protein 1-like isoform X2 [Lethenteron reissneri]|uniref:stromal membrane-associated protein 1-like isoform X2 n=1 Tax=Lethenteron reissneri TaxID=7753 RepID=UPI002AB68886|nr:stromal membrane-associated protein 1-like isoform X2 [Lethenteron reissneri]